MKDADFNTSGVTELDELVWNIFSHLFRDFLPPALGYLSPCHSAMLLHAVPSVGRVRLVLLDFASRVPVPRASKSRESFGQWVDRRQSFARCPTCSTDMSTLPLN
jgi:hypothetical protein